MQNFHFAVDQIRLRGIEHEPDCIAIWHKADVGQFECLR